MQTIIEFKGTLRKRNFGLCKDNYKVKLNDSDDIFRRYLTVSNEMKLSNGYYCNEKSRRKIQIYQTINHEFSLFHQMYEISRQ